MLLLNDNWGIMWAMYERNRAPLARQLGIVAEHIADVALNPLAHATIKAQADTDWLILRQNDYTYNCTYTQQRDLYMNRNRPFILVYKQADVNVKAWLRALT